MPTPTREHPGEARRGPQARPGPRVSLDDIPWLWNAVETGLLGAFTVALFFAILDLARGQPLWTPTALGSALFLGESLPPGAAPDAALVVGYSALHGAVFVAVAFQAAFLLMTSERLRIGKLALGALLAAALFVAFEAVFLIFSVLIPSTPVDALGLEFVAIANGLAAAVMASFLVLRVRPRSPLAEPGSHLG
jgi:hypothetical protein